MPISLADLLKSATSADDRSSEFAFGGAIKSFEVKGNVGIARGYTVRYTDPSDKDLTGDYFIKATDLGANVANGYDVFVHHRQPVNSNPAMMKYVKRKLRYPCKTTPDEIGLFCETLFDLADEYEAALFNGPVKAGKLGYSSGSAPHLVDKDPDGCIKRWIIAEVSLTPTPAEPDNTVTAVKSLSDIVLSDLLMTPTYIKAEYLSSDTHAAMNDAALDALDAGFWDAVYAVLYEGDASAADRKQQLKDLLKEFSSVFVTTVDRLLKEEEASAEEPTAEGEETPEGEAPVDGEPAVEEAVDELAEVVEEVPAEVPVEDPAAIDPSIDDEEEGMPKAQKMFHAMKVGRALSAESSEHVAAIEGANKSIAKAVKALKRKAAAAAAQNAAKPAAGKPAVKPAVRPAAAPKSITTDEVNALIEEKLKSYTAPTVTPIALADVVKSTSVADSTADTVSLASLLS
jgi:hypothetical protein